MDAGWTGSPHAGRFRQRYVYSSRFGDVDEAALDFASSGTWTGQDLLNKIRSGWAATAALGKNV